MAMVFRQITLARRWLRQPPFATTILALVMLLAIGYPAEQVSANDHAESTGTTSTFKLNAVAEHDTARIRLPRSGTDEMATTIEPTILASSPDFYLDAIATVPYNGSYSDVYLSSGWDTSCGFWACGRTLTYEYTRTIWYGTDPWNAYSMQLNNIWTQSGFGVGSATCTIGWPFAVSCTVSGFSGKTVTKTGPVWYDLWSIYNEFFSGVVDFDDFLLLGQLTETAVSTICYYPGQCQTFQATDSGP